MTSPRRKSLPSRRGLVHRRYQTGEYNHFRTIAQGNGLAANEVWRQRMNTVKRPRVAAIGLDDSQVESIRPLCGDLRTAQTLSGYSQDYSLTETDLVVAANFHYSGVLSGVHLLTIGPMFSGRRPRAGVGSPKFTGLARTDSENTERELRVSMACPPIYAELARRLLSDLGYVGKPPPIVVGTESFRSHREALVETLLGRHVAVRLQLTGPDGPVTRTRPLVDPIALLLPEIANLAEWFRAFLTDIHEIDPVRVPQLPPRLSVPADWYTLEESALAERITTIDLQSERLANEREKIEAELAEESIKADAGIRRAISEDGDELVAAVSEILTDLDFQVRDMDANVKPNEAKREDLRLTLDDQPDWEAIVEVKGYPNGTKTNGARQIREQREHYRDEKGQFPDLTVWLANPFRRIDPSSRPSPGSQVEEAAANIGALHVLSTDLYKQWALMKRGKLDAHDVVKSLTDAEPGLWRPPTPPSKT